MLQTMRLLLVGLEHVSVWQPCAGTYAASCYLLMPLLAH